MYKAGVFHSGFFIAIFDEHTGKIIRNFAVRFIKV